MGLCYLLTLYCFIRYAEGKARGGRGLGGCSRFRRLPPAAWATKEVMASAPVMVFLYDRDLSRAASVRAALAAARRKLHPGALAGHLDSSWPASCCPITSAGAAPPDLASPGITCRRITSRLQFPALRPLSPARGLAPSPGLPTTAPGGRRGPGTGRDCRRWSCWPSPRPRPLWPRSGGASPAGPRLRWGVWFFAILAPTSLDARAICQTLAEHRMYLALAPVLAVLVVGARPRRLAALGAGRPIAAVDPRDLPGAGGRRRGPDRPAQRGLPQRTSPCGPTPVAKVPGNPYAQADLGVALDRSSGRARWARWPRALCTEALRLKPDLPSPAQGARRHGHRPREAGTPAGSAGPVRGGPAPHARFPCGPQRPRERAAAGGPPGGGRGRAARSGAAAAGLRHGLAQPGPRLQQWRAAGPRPSRPTSGPRNWSRPTRRRIFSSPTFWRAQPGPSSSAMAGAGPRPSRPIGGPRNWSRRTRRRTCSSPTFWRRTATDCAAAVTGPIRALSLRLNPRSVQAAHDHLGHALAALGRADAAARELAEAAPAPA